MKKCPYCHTFMNDDVNSCPNCLKDMSSLKPMPEVNPIGSNKNLNLIIYGTFSYRYWHHYYRHNSNA